MVTPVLMRIQITIALTLTGSILGGFQVQVVHPQGTILGLNDHILLHARFVTEVVLTIPQSLVLAGTILLVCLVF